MPVIQDNQFATVTTLYDELDTLRNAICNKCKQKIVSGATSSSSAGHSSSSGYPLPPQTNSQTEIISPSTDRITFEPSFISPPATQPQPADVDNFPNSPEAKPDEAGWSVVHNDKVMQTLDVHLTHTFKMKSEVYCVKFSREGDCLAMGLDSGEAYIYNIKTLSYRFISLLRWDWIPADLGPGRALCEGKIPYMGSAIYPR